MNISKYTLVDNDLNDFQVIFQKLDLPSEIILNEIPFREDNRGEAGRLSIEETTNIPSINDFAKFRKWMLERIKDIEGLLN